MAGKLSGIVFASLTLAVAASASETPVFGPADPIPKDEARFDPARPIERELKTDLPNGFTFDAVGDLIASRPLSQYAPTIPGFKAVLDLFKRADALYGNMETTILDIRSFQGSPYAWDGDWANEALPGVAADLKAMGFSIVSRANNHALDWGVDGMRETGRWLDQAGIVHAGAGENRGLARAPRYFESAKGRVALVSLASTFRPTTDALPPEGAAPGRPGISALHLTRTVEVPDAAMKALAQANCVLHHQDCGEVPGELDLLGTHYRRAQAFSYTYAMDPEDLAEIYKSIREARENADFVVVSIHSHECSIDCDDGEKPFSPGDFLKILAHGAIDSGADVFVATGNHNLGPIEIYHSAARGPRPIFYGLGNFFWSDIQEPIPHDLFQGNRQMLADTWVDPSKATDYDLTAPLNKASFAHEFTFESVVAACRFDGGRLVEVRLHPIEDGYGSKLTLSGIPRLVTERAVAARIFKRITDQTEHFGLPALKLAVADSVAVIQP
jgi:poly-gamma-glutamate synthesis protein (capsule biosynthesis protein)